MALPKLPDHHTVEGGDHDRVRVGTNYRGDRRGGGVHRSWIRMGDGSHDDAVERHDCGVASGSGLLAFPGVGAIAPEHGGIAMNAKRTILRVLSHFGMFDLEWFDEMRRISADAARQREIDEALIMTDPKDMARWLQEPQGRHERRKVER